ncbi:Serine/threonine-protein phosphatase 2B catalytic subunit 2 [Folsomia candida]|uniref:Serine/threonine-protein phosphatase 2B catalytic subunit 2 n=1 Tax=Folsomia candida TaxID=158441 RepID=A0A226D7U1_FOLCA|nr:Serine/threonine-protein phosphatase 2B catalytic subunit 2 [Folsomia candida]
MTPSTTIPMDLTFPTEEATTTPTTPMDLAFPTEEATTTPTAPLDLTFLTEEVTTTAAAPEFDTTLAEVDNETTGPPNHKIGLSLHWILRIRQLSNLKRWLLIQWNQFLLRKTETHSSCFGFYWVVLGWW